MESFFQRCTDEQFWADKDRVRLLIELYEANSCLWNVKNADYKVQSKKRNAKNEIGKHFGWTGKLGPTCLQ